MTKLASILRKIYGYGIVFALFGGGATVFGYIVAMCIGGETAEIISTFIYKKLFLWLIIGADIVVLLGLVSMYLSREKTMILEGKKKRKKISC